MSEDIRGAAALEPRVAVLGVGGAGCNVVSYLRDSLTTFDTIAVNTDKTALMSASADKKIYICKEVTRGEGTHGDTRLGKKCAQVHEDEIRQALVGHDAVFIVAGLGGGTGTGAVSVIADLCSQMRMMVFSIVIEPFSFETSKLSSAAEGLRNLRSVCRNVTRFQNNLIVGQMPDFTLDSAFGEVNSCIARYIKASADKIPGFIRNELDTVARTMPKKEQSEFSDIVDIRKASAVQY